MSSLNFGLTVFLLLTSLSPFTVAQSLPQVDLGYEIHQAIAFNQSGQTYNFSNIRYVQPPVGELRFAAPVPPAGRNPAVQNGSFGPICPQAAPAWGLISEAFVTSYLAGNASTFNYTQAELALQQYLAAAANTTYKPGPQETEDCLFLDVIVPKAVFDAANSPRRRRQSGGANVLVWIYGGGYVGGSKSSINSGNPSGLIKASQANGDPGVIFVAMNYRVGAFGWLAGPTLQSEGGVSNAGLYDQRLALEWVQNNIHLFGGDPTKVTVMGESAGGGSIEHQIIAYGGQKPVPFARAILQSPGFVPTSSLYLQDNITQSFLTTLNVSSIEEARNASSLALMAANYEFVGLAPYGSFQFGPVADGIFVPTVPGVAFLAGAFAQNITVMAGHNTNEAPAFTPPFLETDADLAAYLEQAFPGILTPALNNIIHTLYPLSNYPAPIYRTLAIVNELFFQCNTDYVARAYGNRTYNYQFEVPPALHGYDVQYSFYNGQPTNITADLFAPVAQTMQGYLVNFAMMGNPNGPGLPYFPMQGINATQMGLNVSISATGVTPNIMVQKDPTANARCAWLQKGLYL
ncbi:hypothetical protein LTS15_003975 [Exophiala xenobiotica]|nr:hypothetical protein LTS15_003975 [Exophiala xenobiotica]